VPRSRIIEVDERLDAFGAVVTALQSQEAERAARAVAELEPEAVAICLAFAHLDPVHEEMIERAVANVLPGVPVYLSSRVNPQIEEYPRASTTAISAYVGPVVDRYVSVLDQALSEAGIDATLRLMRSDGGVSTPAAVRRNPAHTLFSGPAGGVIAGSGIAQELSLTNMVTFDMGGTSADFSAIVGGEPRMVMEREVESRPLRLPTLDIETISAGGGSIAWVDLGGALRVGPKSAGADPGPACYGLGGDDATVTDAAVVLGILDPAEYLGGEMRIDAELARKSVQRVVAEPLGLDLETAALGIVTVANASMVQAIQRLSVERGLDVREFTLLAFGGAGPIYAPFIARELGMAEVLVPRNPGVYAAQGLLMSDIRHTAQAAYNTPLSKVDEVVLRDRLVQLADDLDRALKEDGVAPGDRMLRFAGEMRCIGQFHELHVPLPTPEGIGWWDAEATAAAFHREHERAYGHADTTVLIEFVNLRVEALGRVLKPATPKIARAPRPEPPLAKTRPVYLDRDSRFQDCPIYRRDDLLSGHEITGPAIVTQRDSTTVVLANQDALVTAQGFLSIKEAEDPA
jgi:N-methylhydantoinase A